MNTTPIAHLPGTAATRDEAFDLIDEEYGPLLADANMVSLHPITREDGQLWIREAWSGKVVSVIVDDTGVYQVFQTIEHLVDEVA